MGIFDVFFDSNLTTVKSYTKIVEQINFLESQFEKLTDKQLKAKTAEFKNRYRSGETLDQLLPEAYAVSREATKRTLGMRHFDVQLIAAIALHHSKISEQKTGEGKTLSAVPALYLNAITGEGVHLVTVNDYLSMRDCGWMSPIYHSLDISSTVIVHEQAFLYDSKYQNTNHTDERLQQLRPITRKEAYQADITYGTNNEFGFDYLRDNMVKSLAQQSQRGHHFAIVDEVDSILIDEARTPLIISSPAQEPTEKYYQFSKLIQKLDAITDYTIDEKQKSASLTENGILKLEQILKVDNLYEKDFSTLHHLEQALKAKAIFHKDREYVVRDNEVVIVDEFTGRLMPGRRYSEGLHQAIEAKENVSIQQESQTLATISFQNYFRMYEKLAGMTGTAATEAEEFHKIYKLEVVIIPTHRDLIRVDHADVIYKTLKAKYEAVADSIQEIHKSGQPVLIGTTSIEKNELLSSLLKKRGVSHALLNAKNHEKEAEIIAAAGEKGAVTVATNMAGRGVDIKLGKEVDQLGGLYVIGTERHESRRIDNQLRGRSGRQGDPGATKFFISLEDDLIRIFGGEQISKVMNFLKMPEDAPIEHPMISKAMESAQVKVEGHNFDIRKTTVEYDDVMNQQRKIIYGIRKKVLEASDNPTGESSQSLKEDILEKINNEISQIVMLHSQDELDIAKIIEEFSNIINFDPPSKKELEKKLATTGSTDEISSFLSGLAKDLYEAREKEVSEEVARQMEIFVYLNTIDTLWIAHLDTMDDLRAGIGLRGYAQRDPLIEYKKEGFELFGKLIKTIDHEIVYRIFKVSVTDPRAAQSQPIQVEVKRPEIEAGIATEESSNTKVTIQRGEQVISSQSLGSNGQTKSAHPKLGRNDPCWCGSGKKYKKCHYPN